MIVLIAGMQRSGSTFSFNIARELLMKTGTVNCISSNTYTEAMVNAEKYNHLIVKSHFPDNELTNLVTHKQIKCICTYRNPINSIQSWMEVFGFSFNDSLDMVTRWAIWHKDIKVHTHNIPFKMVDKHQLITTIDISKYIFGKPKLFSSYRISTKYSKKNIIRQVSTNKNLHKLTDKKNNYQEYDKTTFLHQNHINKTSSKFTYNNISDEQKKIIINRFISNNLDEYLKA